MLAVPSNDDDFLYISSGTWSLMGIERKTADCSELSRKYNFTNEGGYDHRFRYLKNIMGLWMIQNVKRELEKYSYDDLCKLAEKSDCRSRVDVDSDYFLAPENMIEAVKEFCRNSGQAVPESAGDLAACIYHSLAESYARAAAQIEELTGKKYSRIHIVGGGSSDSYLNRLTAEYTGKEVHAGPKEATAIGNLAVQLLHCGEIENVESARNTIYKSFDVIKV